MAYRVILKPAAERDLSSLPRDVLRRVDSRIRALSEDQRPHGSKKLAGGGGLYRIRVGEYRVIYAVQDDALLVIVVRVRHRRDAYR